MPTSTENGKEVPVCGLIAAVAWQPWQDVQSVIEPAGSEEPGLTPTKRLGAT
ncbi:hypothetical protein ILP92_03335 [Maribius pontilimi]|uniref:Uncharacterized protein n=1 Tax=Palleronia pontilimi TaxID=1964209 RepID=A0A934I9Z2_9RHOB|nr:hypothetical protein [Palleronia pontilimi]MBJ3761781.1 hypothetical protein [Palleronia pontilimi]